MSDKIRITGDIGGMASFVMQQNHVPIIRRLVVGNTSDEVLKDLKLSITTDPDMTDVADIDIDSILPGQERVLTGVDLHLSAAKLSGLTERVDGSVIVTVASDQGEVTREVMDMAFLSYDEWSGANTLPEFLAFFITPNHPYITEIIKKAGTLLERWTGSPSFTGYRSGNPNNVGKQMAAIYGALQQERIDYCVPPASFEENGQKVRLCDKIREQKLGTCLDLSLLYAACLEAVGLNAMVILVKGHAFAGCWLIEETFAECVQDDVSAITKRTDEGIGEICVVEATAFATGKNMHFEEASEVAGNRLKKADDFIYLVDVKRTRGSGIRPMPLKNEDGTYSFNEDLHGGRKAGVTDMPGDMEIRARLQQVDSIEYTKQQMWERKLLDLSLRNSLLNFRMTKNAIQLLTNSLHELEDALAGGEEFQIMACPRDMMDSPRDNKIYESINNESIWDSLIKSEFKNHRIRTYLGETDLGAIITNLYRSAKTSMEENGANTLYIALGFLKWFESGVSEKARYAPLILLPIDVVRKSAQRGYVFRLRDEEPQFNVTLLEMLRMNYGMAVTGLDPLPVDEKGIDIKGIFHVVRQMVMGKPHWDVEEFAVIGIFSFTQFIMWNDIRNRMGDLKKNKVVKSLTSGRMEWETDIRFPTPSELDETVRPSELAVPISADSSQLAAIYAAGKGQSFVLHGPPGTGKSQTITNIIANALYKGKSVLFVAEKMAALSVVERRLDSIGIGDFCLELHSNKARKKDVLGQLERVLDIGRIKPPAAYGEEAEEIFALRGELNDVVNEMHAARNFGFSLYEAISNVERYADYPDCMRFENDQIASLTPKKYSHIVQLCEMLATAANACGGVQEHALKEYKNPRFGQNDKANLEADLREYVRVLPELEKSAERVSVALGLNRIRTNTQYRAAAGMARLLVDAITIPTAMLMKKDLYFFTERIYAACECGRKQDSIWNGLSGEFKESVLAINSANVNAKWEKAEGKWFITRARRKKRISKLLMRHAKDKRGYNKADTPKYIKMLVEYQANNMVVSEAEDMLYGLFIKNDAGKLADGQDGTDSKDLYPKEGRQAGRSIGRQDNPVSKEGRQVGRSIGRQDGMGSRDPYPRDGRQAGKRYNADSMVSYPMDGRFYDQGYKWDLIEEVTKNAINIQQLARLSSDGEVSRQNCMTRLCEALCGEYVTFSNEDRSAFGRLAAASSRADDLKARLSEQFMNMFDQWNREPDYVQASLHQMTRALSGIDGLRDYCAYLQVKEELGAEGMGDVCGVLEDGTVGDGEFMGTFTKNISKACAMHVLDTVPALASFRGKLHMRKIERFKEIFKRYEMLTRQELAARLSAQIPILDTGVSASSEMGILRRAIKSGGRMMPVRKLFESIPNLLRKLSPCMLMSPISVAQYLDPKYPLFDLVVFDEASQLPTSESVGAIARGNDLIVVGDPNQMPPTSFFSSNQIDEDNYEKEDLESVLDDCLALSMPQEHLLWHYRSKHESLIAFSNRKYYDNKLFTFPSPNDMVSKVRLIDVEGFYDRGKTKQNKAEAEAIVREVMSRLADPEYKRLSMGVVTFSQVQQKLIMDMLEAEFAKYPELDDVANNAEEPIFVKNLENVQGDERDVILFSIGYGPDEQGRVALNFGPLNREGGWRRLNVAISRARYEMLIFSVLKPEQIDLNRTRSEGLAGLKEFLVFAQRGKEATLADDAGRETRHDMVETIADRIRLLGYEVHTNIGCSGYHIDIGVVNPNESDTYVLGIICDGLNYLNGGMAADRNMTQESVLRGLGWELCRVWTLDWWDNANKELGRIKVEIERSIEKCETGARDGSSLAAGTKAEDLADKGMADAGMKGVGAKDADQDKDGAYQNGGTREASDTSGFERMEYDASQNIQNMYIPTSLASVTAYQGNSEFFASYESTNILIRQIETVLKREAPVSREVLCKRVLEAWGISRMGTRLNKRFDDVLAAMRVRSTRSGDTMFYWDRGVDPAQYEEFRVSSADEKYRRGMENIAAEEIAVAIRYILQRQIGMGMEDLEREVARAFSFGRCTESMQRRIKLGVEVAVRKKWARVVGERITVRE